MKKSVIPLGEKRALLGQQYVCNHSVLVKYFRKTPNSQQVLLLDDLEREIDVGSISSRQLTSLIDEMRRLKVSLCVSLIGQDNFLGVLCVGEKKNKDPYFVADLEWLDIVSRQFGLAIERSALYDNLERLVELRTKKLIGVNQQLKQISEAKSEFVSVASHQLRTPLTVINSILSLLVDGDLGDLNVQQVEYVSRSLLQSQKLIKLINQLLSISRIEAGRMNLKIEVSNLNSLIKENVNALKYLAKEKGVQLKMKLALDLPLIHLDRSLISEVLANLIDNSIKYSPKGKIVIQSIYKKGMVRVEISDNGIGLTKEEKTNLFKRFIRGSQQSRLLVSGTGLGLYFARRVIDSHNGTIWAESKGINKGATFIFELPIK
jgi:signal transduction histidine kinase